MTPRLIDLALRAWVRRQRIDWERGLTLAWQTAQLTAIGQHNPKKFPALRDVIPSEDRRRRGRRGRATPDQMKAWARQWNAVVGGLEG